MFKVGDIVEITAEAAATGMLDFTQGHRYRVHKTRPSEYGGHLQVFMLNDSGITGWYHQIHFKLKEDTIVEKKECLFKEGQVVWDVAFGKGVVRSITNRNDPDRPITVGFNGDLLHYTRDGAYSKQRYRTLFFSEPKIEAATEPLFEPTLKKGDVVAVCSKGTSVGVAMGIVTQETETVVYFDPSDYGYAKEGFDFYRLGEKINFK